MGIRGLCFPFYLKPETRNLKLLPRLHHSRQRDNIDLADAGFSKGFGAFIDGGPRREHVVDKEDTFVTQDCGLSHNKRTSEIFDAGFPF